MNVDSNMILSVVTTLGGFELIKWIVNLIRNRKTDKRKQEAEADNLEFGTLKETVKFLQEQLLEKEKRFCEQTDRLRKVQDDYFELMKKHSQTELDLQRYRCIRKKCESRAPQNGY